MRVSACIWAELIVKENHPSIEPFYLDDRVDAGEFEATGFKPDLSFFCR